MRASTKVLGVIVVLATCGSTTSFAQGQEAPGQSTSMPIVSTMPQADADAAVLGRGNGAGQEAPGQSEAAPIQSTLSADDVHQQAVTRANSGAGQEAPGQSTSMAPSQN